MHNSTLPHRPRRKRGRAGGRAPRTPASCKRWLGAIDPDTDPKHLTLELVAQEVRVLRDVGAQLLRGGIGLRRNQLEAERRALAEEAPCFGYAADHWCCVDTEQNVSSSGWPDNRRTSKSM